MAYRVRVLTSHAWGVSRWMMARERRWIALLAAALVALGTFLEIAEELVEDSELLALDNHVLRTVATFRRPWLTIPAIDITALGSLTLLALMAVCAGISLLLVRDYRGTLQLALAMLGVALWTFLAKHTFARERPDVLQRLLEVPGYSFPSGHSSGSAALYLTLAIVLGRHVRSLRGRIWLLALTSLLALTIGLSRVYLGVHYPSDVASGLIFGAGWALLLTSAFELHHYRGWRFTPRTALPRPASQRSVAGGSQASTVSTSDVDSSP